MKNILLLIALLKAHGIRLVIASPGSTNMSFIGSIQQDPFFKIYSCVDERSAAYMACGLAEETGEPVVISCTGATASRNYMSALTEAYYRKLPILAVTSTRHQGEMGQNIPQAVDRSVIPNDIAKLSVHIPSFTSASDFDIYTTLINRAILELDHRGKGPVHINLATYYSEVYDVDVLPNVRKINRVTPNDELPSLNHRRVGVFVGAHSKWNEQDTKVLEQFCEKYGAIVLCDRTSNYYGDHRILPTLAVSQKKYHSPCNNFDLLIHIGNISGSYFHFNAQEVWRVNPDGHICDTFKKMRYVFEFEEREFFNAYLVNNDNPSSNQDFEDEWRTEIKRLESNIPDLPFSHIWIAQQILKTIPANSILHMGILSSLRSWNFFESTYPIYGFCNTGGFGIDGCLSSLIGASFAHPTKLYYGVVGDLAFFYDMNSLGNRHIGRNIRLIIINNGRGQEFCNYAHAGSKFNGNERKYIAAEGHYGSKSHNLIRNYAIDLGLEYLCASNKDEFMEVVDRFMSPELVNKSIVFEIFTEGADESDALRIMYNLEFDMKNATKHLIKSFVGESNISKIKKILNH